MLVAVTTEGTAAAFQDQDKEALRAGLPTGKDKESLEEALKSLSLSGSSFADSVAGFVLAKHDALMPFAPSAPAPANDAHPTVDNVKVATASTFQRVVIDSANPVIVVIDVEDHAPLNKLAFVMAQMFARNNIAVDVVTYDPALNKVDDDLINTGDFAPMYVFVKQTAAEAEAAKAKAAAETAAAAADKKGKKISFDIPAEKLAQPSNVSVKNAAGLTVRAFTLDLSSTAKSGKKAAAEGADEDEDEDEDEQEQDEEGEQRMPLPTCANLLKFLTEAGVAVTESEDVTKDCKVIEDYFKVGSQMAEALRSMLNMARVLPNQKYSFAAGSAQATALLQLVTFITFLVRTKAKPIRAASFAYLSLNFNSKTLSHYFFLLLFALRCFLHYFVDRRRRMCSRAPPTPPSCGATSWSSLPRRPRCCPTRCPPSAWPSPCWRRRA